VVNVQQLFGVVDPLRTGTKFRDDNDKLWKFVDRDDTP
jgi:hypothetical protein